VTTLLATSLADRARDLYDQLDHLASTAGLEPSPRVDAAFSELVALCLTPGEDAEVVLADPRVEAVLPRLRALCADGEYRLERAWARRVSVAPEDLALFPYLDNYQDLTALEVHAVAGLRRGAGVPRVCVLGSGPLPLTALLTARTLGGRVDAVDVSGEATELAAAVLERLPGGDLVRVHRADARSSADVEEADVVVLAALVGLDAAEKRAVIGAVADRMRSGAVLVVRSAHRLRTLIYPPVTPADLRAAPLRLLAEVRPWNDVVNSVLIARRK
jgi:nicotianamine synthase